MTSAQHGPRFGRPPEAVRPDEHAGEWRMTGCVIAVFPEDLQEVVWYWQREVPEEELYPEADD